MIQYFDVFIPLIYLIYIYYTLGVACPLIEYRQLQQIAQHLKAFHSVIHLFVYIYYLIYHCHLSQAYLISAHGCGSDVLSSIVAIVVFCMAVSMAIVKASARGRLRANPISSPISPPANITVIADPVIGGWYSI